MGKFQSTPLAGGATMQNRNGSTLLRQFQSTPLAGGATSGNKNHYIYWAKFQSTPLAGGATGIPCGVYWFSYDFNPRPSREGRPINNFSCGSPRLFQSTPLAGGATEEDLSYLRDIAISIHAPRGRGDGWTRVKIISWKDFNPRPSREGRLTARVER